LTAKETTIIIIMTAAEVAAAKIKGAKRELMGNDVRCHSGARSLVHKDRRERSKSFGRYQKEAARRGE
jgi:hypothetical protein